MNVAFAVLFREGFVLDFKQLMRFARSSERFKAPAAQVLASQPHWSRAGAFADTLTRCCKQWASKV